MRQHLLGALAAASLAVAAPVAANASVFYDLTVDQCSGGCGLTNYGSIEVSGSGDTLTFAFDLADNVIFNEAGKHTKDHDSIWFNLNEASTTVGGLGVPFSANGLQSAGSFSPNGAAFGTFDYLVHEKGGDGVSRNGNPTTAAGGINTMTFTVKGVAPVLVGEPVGLDSLFFVVDVAAYGATGAVLTGHVGAVKRADLPPPPPPPPPPGVPEPAAWALMLVGFGGMGALLRRNRRIARTAVA